MENHTLYDLARLIDDKTSLEEELTQSMRLLQDRLQKKYINRFYSLTENEEHETKQHPPREVRLLSALKDFMPPEAQGRTESIKNLLMTIGTLQNLRKGLENISQKDGLVLQSQDISCQDCDPIPSAAAIQTTEMLCALALLKKL